ncbi:alpha-amylase family glycosyl hydrolase [Winogradskyella thalassocola]|uniref:Por secretion system C-terminal sorting domain-containing protein n=1 Tax=Winogradskyella thalassocola TaxID=262004 RepID=A0A1G7YAQ0_9FLAO|nr:alpha-amylase family glycosyl hydrolase [Winogradskyella thalassocola]SDG93474.1 Por secretion system C-terminal sorting domain-containing protein [Winogradskyella thalassocola]
MKKILLTLFIVFSYFAHAQVSLSVSAIEVDQPVTITVDANSTDSNCNGLNNPTKVYMHSGIGNNSDAFGFGVVGNWGQDDGVGEMTNNGDGTFSITITPQTYYGITQAQANSATQIGMVFRNESGNQELKDDGCNDFIFPVGKVIINIIQPTNEIVVVNSGSNLSLTATITYQGSTTVSGAFEIFYNNVSVANGTCGFPACNSTLTNITESGTVKFVGTPPGSSDTGEASFEVIVVPTVTEQALPANMIDGINYHADATKATLVLTAPGKEFIQVAGSWNNYSPSNSDVMKRDPSTGKYWLEVSGLTSGAIETYQYWVFDTNPIANSPSIVKVADPYSPLVLSPFDDSYIPASTYPNMPVYPAGQEREVTVLQTGQTPYNWQVANFTKPVEEDLVIYEVLIRDFDADRNFQDIIDRIDYFKNLNVNAIELLPIMEYEGNESWGYNTAFHMAIDKFYGTQEKFKELVDICHQNGIAVILDIAFNHAFGRNPMVRMWMDDPDGDGWGGPSTENPYFNVYPTHSYSVGNDFNHSSDYTKDYVKQVVSYWIEEYKIDGFRWDLTKGFTQNCGNGTYDGDEGCTGSYQQDRVDVLKEYADHSWAVDPDHYVIFEHLGSDNEEKEWANYKFSEGKGVMMWGNMNSQYGEITMAEGGDKNINRMGHKAHSGFNGPRLVGYTESHDEERLMYKNVAFGNTSNSNHNVRDLNTALSRMSALGAVSVMVPGPKMIWHFGELGMDNSIFTCNDGSYDNDGCKLDTKPQPQWANNWLTDALRSQIYDDWSKLHKLKIEEPVFEGDYAITSGNLTPRIDIFDNSIPTSALKNVIIYANFDVVTRSIDTNFPGGVTTTWYDLMDATGNTTVSNSTSAITIPAGQFRILGNKASDVLSVDDEALLKFSIYPNPSQTAFSINVNVSNVEVYDLTGKLVKSFKGDFTRTDSFDVSSLNSGIYMVKVQNDTNQTLTTKLVKL